MRLFFAQPELPVETLEAAAKDRLVLDELVEQSRAFEANTTAEEAQPELQSYRFYNGSGYVIAVYDEDMLAEHDGKLTQLFNKSAGEA
jgi:hypothetical protein